MTRLNVECLEGRELMAAGVMAGIEPATSYTAPIGSNKGSLTAEPQANGIIAILIGLQAPTQPTPDSTHAKSAIVDSNDVFASSFQGGCNASRDDVAAHSFYHVLPYIEQENLYKLYN